MRTILPALIFTTLATASCGDSQSPEAQVKGVIGAMEAAAEARDVGDLMEHVSSEYRDAYGQGPDEASRYVRGYFIANQQIHLLTRVDAVEFPSDREARATVLVGMVSRDADTAAAWSLAADLYEFDLALVREDGDWKVTYAEWRRK